MTKCKCGQEFSEWDDYKYHFFHECSEGPQEKDRGQHLYRCKHCGGGFRYAKDHMHHVANCPENGNELMKHCNYCNKTFEDAEDRWYHELNCPKQCEKKFKCPYCCERMGHERYYYAHISTCRKKPAQKTEKPVTRISTSYPAYPDYHDYYDPDITAAYSYGHEVNRTRGMGNDLLLP